MTTTRLLFLLATTAAALTAQYPTSPTQNLSVADRTGEQVVDKLAATSDGGCYIGWFDNSSGGYQVWLQHLDASGNELWPHNGILVSSNPQSTSLQDWDLIADSEDFCVLAFTDTRAGSDLDVYAYRIAPNGTMVWGNNGVALSNNNDYEANPRICESSIGDFVFVWSNGGPATLDVQRLDRAGNPMYTPGPLSIAGDAGATPGFVRVAAGDNGSVILSWVRTIAFTGNKHVHAQKYDVLGAPLWNAGTRLPVFDLASVPIAHEPRILADGAGGAIFAWHYALGQAFSVRVQHVLANGTELYAHNGVDVCPNTNSKFDPAIAFDPATQDIFVCWNERNQAQSTWGISAQKVDALGNLQWGAFGTTLIPISATVRFAPVCARVGTGIVCSVLEESLGGLNDKLLAMRLDAAGNVLWQPPVDVSTVASDKLRLVTASTPSGVTLLAWTDARADSGNVVVQNVNPDGRLGDRTGAFTSYGCGVNPNGSLVTSGRPAIGTTCTLSIDNPLATQAPGSLALLLLSLRADASYPCGTQVPGLGMNGVGEVLIQAPLTTRIGGAWAGTGQPVAFPLTLPWQVALAGLPLYAQGMLFDFSPTASHVVGLTTAVRLTVGF